MRLFSCSVFIVGLLAGLSAKADSIEQSMLASASGNGQQAASLLDRLIAGGGPQATQALVLKGRFLFLAKRYRQAQQAYQLALRQAPEDSPLSYKAQFGLAECYALEGDYKRAEKKFSGALDRISSPKRREKAAMRFLRLGDLLRSPQDKEVSEDPQGAESFYRVVLEMETGGALQQEAALKVGLALLEQNKDNKAAQHLTQFIQDNPDSPLVAEAALAAGRAFYHLHQGPPSRRYLRQVLRLSPKSKLAARAALLIGQSYGMPHPTDGQQLALGQKALQFFIDTFPQHNKVEQTRWHLVSAPMALGRDADLETGLVDFIKRGASEIYLAKARFALASTWERQKRYREAKQGFRQFLQLHPTDSAWLKARQALQRISLSQIADATRVEEWQTVIELCRSFIARYPASDQTPQVMLSYAAAQQRRKLWSEALKTLHTLTSKFPDANTAGQGWLAIGNIQEQLNNVQKAREAYKKGGDTTLPQLQALQSESLTIEQPQTFALGEGPYLSWHIRNIDRVTLRLYRMQAEDFFRDRFDLSSITDVDVALCTPDKTWQQPVDNYRKYKRIKQRVPLPIHRAGLYLVHMSAGKLEATTAVLVTDVGLVLKSAPGEVLVFVQNVEAAKPRGGMKVLIADDQQVLLQGQTNSDGIFHSTLDATLVQGQLRAFASGWDHIAWSHLTYGGGQPKVAMAARSFLFSDRPAYQPGDTVQMAGIIRDKWNPKGYLEHQSQKAYTLLLTGPDGTVLLRAPVTIDAFGVFSLEAKLDPLASPGFYGFTVTSRDKTKSSFAGNFRVERFALSPAAVTTRFDRPVFFGGEPISGRIFVKHRQGSAVANIPVRYRLHQGPWKTVNTDDSGVVAFEFSSLPFEATEHFALEVQVAKYNLQHTARTLLAIQGFQITARVAQKTIFAGQPFDLDISTIDATGRPKAAALQLEVLQRLPSGGELRVLQKALAVDHSGRLRTGIKLPSTGLHMLRLSGLDRAGHPIFVETAVTGIGEKDPGIFLSVDKAVQTQGRMAQVTIHSRLKRALVLLTSETDRFLGHRSVVVRRGANRLELPMDRALVPNFVLAASAMQGDRFYQAEREIEVSQKLNIQIVADKTDYTPGAQVELSVSATDHDNRPVDARVLLAVVDSALLEKYPDNLTPLAAAFFQRRPTGQIVTAPSNVFQFSQVNAQLAARIDIQERSGSAALLALDEQRRELTAEGVGLLGAMTGNAFGAGGLGISGRGHGGGGVGISSGKAMVLGGMGRGMDRGTTGHNWLRSFFEHTAAFYPALRTGPKGTTTVRFRLPDSLTTWTVTARAVTRQTQLGEQKTTLVARKDFWVELVAPTQLTIGDVLQPMARVHNLTDAAIDVDLALHFKNLQAPKDPRLPAQSKTTTVQAWRSGEILFDRISPKGTLHLELQATTKHPEVNDGTTAKILVRPRGTEQWLSTAGRLHETTTKTLQLDPEWKTPSLTVQVASSPLTFIGPVTQHSLLHRDRPETALTAVYQLKILAKKSNPGLDLQQRQLQQKLVHLLALQRHDGGWGVSARAQQSQPLLTVQAVLALSHAQKMHVGFPFPQKHYAKATSYLRQSLQDLDTGDWRQRCAVVYALTAGNPQNAPKEQMLRMHRLRNKLPLEALAYLGLAWQLQHRQQRVHEIAELITKKISFASTTVVPNWTTSWQRDAASTALALHFLAKVGTSSPLLKQGRQWLTTEGLKATQNCPRIAAAVSGALYAMATKSGDKGTLTVLVNGQLAGSLKLAASSTDTAGQTLVVSPALLKKGANTLQLKRRGGGPGYFVATARGLVDSKQIQKNAPVVVRRWVEPLPHPYRGVEIKAGFDTVIPGSQEPWFNAIDRSKIGQKVQVTLEIRQESDHPLGPVALLENIPAGFDLVPGSPKGPFVHWSRAQQRLVFFPRHGRKVLRIRYLLASMNPGSYTFTPAQLVALRSPTTRALSDPLPFTVEPLAATLPATRVTPDELYHRGLAASVQQDPQTVLTALEQLTQQFALRQEPAQKALAALLFASVAQNDPPRIVKYFELAKERDPDLVIPFASIAAIQKAYRHLQAYEGGLHLARGLAKARFLAEVRGVGVLENNALLDHAHDLLRQIIGSYPDQAQTALATYAFAQVSFDHADQLAQQTPGDDSTKVDRRAALKMAVDLLTQYLGQFPQQERAPEAIYSLATALLQQDNPKLSVAWCQAGLEQHKQAELYPAITYLKAYGHFLLREYEPSLRLCQKVVREAEEPAHLDMARYIMAQIYHARGDMDRALELYRQVEGNFDDAVEVVEHTQKVVLLAPELYEVDAQQQVAIPVTARNVPEVDVRVYRVDLFKLYQLKGTLSQFDDVNLLGVKPMRSSRIAMNDRLGITKKKLVRLDLTPGSYLIVTRGVSELRYTLLLKGGLRCEVVKSPYGDRLRILTSNARGEMIAGAKIQIKAEHDDHFIAGKTDMRGIFVADDIRGPVTVVAQHGNAFGLFRNNPEEEEEEEIRIQEKRQKRALDFSDTSIEGQLAAPKLENAKSFFQQDIKGMSVNQAVE